MKKSLKFVTIGAGAVATVAVAITTAIAAIPDSNSGAITGCYANSNGALRIINAQSGATCLSTEHRITWPSRGIRNAGVWNSSDIYYVNDLVTYHGQSYLAKLQNHAVTPLNTTNWSPLEAHTGPGTALATFHEVQIPDQDTDVEIASLALPAGSWLLTGTVDALNEGSSNAKEVSCQIATDIFTGQIRGTSLVEPSASNTFPMISPVTVSAATTARLTCRWQNEDPESEDSSPMSAAGTLIATPLDGVTLE